MKLIKDLNELRDQYRQEEYVESYENRRFSSIIGKLTHDMEIRAINNTLKQIQPFRLLEIAVGPGRLSKNLKFFNNAVGIDTSKPMLKIAEKNDINKKWSFLNADIINMPFEDNSFDAIVTFRLVRHFTTEDRINSYKEINRVLNKDGILIIDALNRNTGVITRTFDSTHRFFTGLLTGNWNVTYDVKYTKEELEIELNDAGFALDMAYDILKAYNLYFLLNLPFDFMRYIKKSSNNEEDNLYMKLRDKVLNFVINIENSRNYRNCYSWVVVCRKKE